MTVWKRMVAAATVVAAATATAVAGGGIGHAAPGDGSRLVVFGDSIAAGTNMMIQPDERDCMQGEGSWPTRVAQHMGVAGTDDFLDASCWAGGVDSGNGWVLSDQVRFAEGKGAVGEGTEVILIGLGINDSWGNSVDGLLPAVENCALDFINGCDRGAGAAGRVPDPAALTAENYAARMSPVVDYLQYYAPNARIAVVGYPEMTPQRGDEMCTTLLGLPVTQPRGGGLVEYFDALDDAQRGGAELMGLDFVDVRGAFDGHGPCSADPWVAGVADLRDPLTIPFHLTRHGEVVVADVVARQMGL